MSQAQCPSCGRELESVQDKKLMGELFIKYSCGHCKVYFHLVEEGHVKLTEINSNKLRKIDFILKDLK